jgi:hypothetical protein
VIVLALTPRRAEKDQMNKNLILHSNIDKRVAELRHAILKSDRDPEHLQEAMQPFSNAELRSFRAFEQVVWDEVCDEIGRRRCAA